MARAQEQSDQPLSWILAELGLTRSVYYDWLSRGKEGGLTDRVVLPRSPLAALPEEIEAAVAYAKARPRDGYRRLAWMMVDEDVVYLSPSTAESWTDMTCSIGGRNQSRARAGGSLRPLTRTRYGILT